MGFYDVEETAVGATIVKTEYDRMVNEEQQDIIITSCCHSVNLLIQKHFPAELPYLADVLSPMQAHCKDIKRRIPNAKTVFIGPCVAKKDEAQRYDGIVDAVLTFDELTAWLKAEHIELERRFEPNDNSRARFFPTTGGILKTMEMANSNYTYMAIDGTDNCIAALKDIESGKIHRCFIEMSACVRQLRGRPGDGKISPFSHSGLSWQWRSSPVSTISRSTSRIHCCCKNPSRKFRTHSASLRSRKSGKRCIKWAK